MNDVDVESCCAQQAALHGLPVAPGGGGSLDTSVADGEHLLMMM